jgi:hypothetical protein
VFIRRQALDFGIQGGALKPRAACLWLPCSRRAMGDRGWGWVGGGCIALGCFSGPFLPRLVVPLERGAISRSVGPYKGVKSCIAPHRAGEWGHKSPAISYKQWRGRGGGGAGAGEAGRPTSAIPPQPCQQCWNPGVACYGNRVFRGHQIGLFRVDAPATATRASKTSGGIMASAQATRGLY